MIKNYYFFFFVFLCLTFSFQITFGQKITVTGVVKQPPPKYPCQKQFPMVGAQVVVVGTTNAVITDNNGRFSITLDQPATLKISYEPGFEATTIQVDKTIDLGIILLKEQINPLGASFHTFYPYKDGLLDENHAITSTHDYFFHIEYKYTEWGGNFFEGYYWDQTNLRGYTANTIGGGNHLLGETIHRRFLNNGQNIAPNNREFLLPNALSGKIPGLEVIPDISNPGATSFFRIRGAKSILGNQSPMVVLNGMPINTQTLAVPGLSPRLTTRQTRLNDLSLLNLLEVDVVKGSTGTTRWGSRGSQGVLYGTLAGSLNNSRGKFEFSSSVSLNTISKKIHRQKSYGQGTRGLFFQGFPLSLSGNAIEWISSDNSWGDQISQRSGVADVLRTNPSDPLYYGYFENQNGQRQYAIAQKNNRTTYDFYDQVFSPQFGVINSIAYQKPSNTLGNIFFTLEDVNQTLFAQNNQYQRTNIGLSIIKRPRKIKKLLINFKTLYTFGRTDQAPTQFLQGGLLAPPDFGFSIQRGTYVNPQGVSFPERHLTYQNPLGVNAYNGIENPVWLLNNDQNRSRIHRLISNVNLNYKLAENTKINLTAGLDTYQENRQHDYPVYAVNLPLVSNDKHNLNQRQWFFQSNISHLSRLNTRHFSLKSVLGIEWNQQLSKRFSERTQYDFTRENTVFGNVGWGGFFSQRLKYKNIFFLNGTLRYDHWTSFGDGLKNGRIYPSINVSVLLAPHTNQIIPKFFNHIRFYLGWGQAGRLPQETLGQQLLISTHLLTNQPLAPERNNETEAGIEMRFWKERFFASVNVYQNVTNDAIIPFRTPNSVVIQLTNNGRIKNKGIEFNFNGNIIRSKKFIWMLNFNYARNINQVTDLGGSTDLQLYNEGDFVNRAILNHPVGAFYSSEWKRDEQGNLELTPEGFPQRDDTQQNPQDPNPQFRLGLGSTIHYKKFELQLLFEGSYGGKIWNGTKARMYLYGTHQDTDHTIQLSPGQAANLSIYGAANNPQTVASRYAPQADGNYVVRGKIANFGGNDVLLDETWYRFGLPQTSSQFVEDASWTRLRELTLSYTMQGFCFWKKSSIDKIRLAFTARNLFTWTRYAGFDPETFYWGQNAQLRGIDYFNLPNSKSYIFTVQITF